MHMTTQEALEHSIARDRAISETNKQSEAALSPQEDDMNTPEWLKPGIYGAVIGAVFVGVVGFTWGGWVTGGTANDRAMAMSRTMSSPPWCRSASTWRRSDPDAGGQAGNDPRRLDLPAARRAHGGRLGDHARNRCPGPRHRAGLPGIP
jgi:hypothetical protein